MYVCVCVFVCVVAGTRGGCKLHQSTVLCAAGDEYSSEQILWRSSRLAPTVAWCAVVCGPARAWPGGAVAELFNPAGRVSSRGQLRRLSTDAGG